ncbi:hypothetical protein SAMN05421810_103539 [Amycolatopsis arida]|uniref:PPE family protein n=1 Tax=Amycolatopsis arida TaxID=587909 RepID=A0A1I5TJL7_9PSEU|nr:hypothetical protein [Amycolatopsis arida]TDX96083.1 hypothetical protein CLV69_103218 [Amycolatopsis arida]SFP82847.1 hypothetical protein SAMN05421810_103539 [Amycolatopsis arida]
MAYSGAEIFWLMNANAATTEKLDAAQQASHRLEVTHQQMAVTLGRGQMELLQFWKGGGAESASAGLVPLIETSVDAAAKLQAARESMYEQNSAFHETRGALRPLETERPQFDFNDVVLGNPVEVATRWVADNQNNIARYEAYSAATEANRSRLAFDYQPAGLAPGGSVDTTTPASSVDHPGGTSPNVRGGSAYDGPTTTSGYRGGTGGAVAPPPQVNAPAPTPQPQAPAATWTSPTRQPGDATAPSRTAPPPRTPGGGTGYRPPPGQGGTPPPRPNPGFGPGYGPTGGGTGTSPGPRTGGYGPTGGAPRAGGGGYGAAPGRGFGPIGGNPGAPGAPPAPGRGSGVGMPGEPGAARPGAAGAPGATGRGGAPMGAPMGAAGGGRGKGAEDEEHQRKIQVPGEDPEQVFRGQLGKTTPPTIGG